MIGKENIFNQTNSVHMSQNTPV